MIAHFARNYSNLQLEAYWVYHFTTLAPVAGYSQGVPPSTGLDGWEHAPALDELCVGLTGWNCWFKRSAVSGFQPPT